MQFVTEIKNGKILNTDIRQYIGHCPDGRYSFELDKGSRRSVLQNAFYRGTVIEICRHDLGYTKNEMHDVFKNMFLRKEIHDERLGDLFVIQSTSTLSTKKFMDYIDDITIRATGNGIILPDPDPDLYPKQSRRNEKDTNGL